MGPVHEYIIPTGTVPAVSFKESPSQRGLFVEIVVANDTGIKAAFDVCNILRDVRTAPPCPAVAPQLSPVDVCNPFKPPSVCMYKFGR